jgi:hypothetical protein
MFEAYNYSETCLNQTSLGSIIVLEIDRCLVYTRAIAEKFFGQKNGEGHHTIYAMGHSHIDSGQ